MVQPVAVDMTGSRVGPGMLAVGDVHVLWTGLGRNEVVGVRVAMRW